MPTLQQKRLLFNQRWSPTFLLRDDFTTDDAAPLTSPRTAEPGPGSLTAVQTVGNFGIASGELTIPVRTGAPDTGAGSNVRSSATIARATGRALLARLQASGADVNHLSPAIGLFTAQPISSANAEHWGGFYNGNIANVPAGTSITDAAYSNNTYYWLAYALRSAGAFFFFKDGSSWTLGWVDVSGSTANLYPGILARSLTVSGKADSMRVLDLAAPFDSDYGLATQRVSGSVSAGQTFTHGADCLIEFTDTTIPSASNLDLRFRRQDATNYWQVTVTSTGALTLNEVVAGTPTSRGTAAGVIANGDRIVVIAAGTTIRVYEANTLRITYASASNFATATAGELVALGTSGVVNDLISWPRTLSGSAAAILDLAVA